ncbi:MAG: hypothetical protein FWE21_09135 [Defluviitaleaceae bacterium]|nr:hypothetical protein [Defluviitaleaceae bacterium]
MRRKITAFVLLVATLTLSYSFISMAAGEEDGPLPIPNRIVLPVDESED